MINEKLKNEDSLDWYNGQWEIIYFHKHGKAMDHDKRFENKKEAIEFGNYIFSTEKAPENQKWVLVFPKYGTFPLADFTHFIPMPVKKS